MRTIKVGPLLGLESDTLYTVCFSTEKDVQWASIAVDGAKVTCAKTGETPTSIVWRAEYTASLISADRAIAYKIYLNDVLAECCNQRNEWTFIVPGTTSTPKLAYASCNGFSAEKLMKRTQDPYRLWREMQEQHQAAPFSLLIMGGDQLYADNVFSADSVEALKEWNEKSFNAKRDSALTASVADQVEGFYDKIYQERWTNEYMSLMFASIPSVMMWDDHDIFDGWGSFPDELQNCPIFQCIFKVARKYFELFQLRAKSNTSLLQPGANHYAFALKFRDYHIVALDNRSERTLRTIMSDAQWSAVDAYLRNTVTDDHLLLLSGVPVVYRDFSFTNSVFEFTPWEEELTDDLKDHWRAKEHEGERAKLIHKLLANAEIRRKQNPDNKTVILSGDVHIGSLGVIRDSARDCKIHQVVSSGIVHPAPSRLQWMGIMAVTNDNDEYLDEGRTIHISMLKPFASDKYIRSRNYVTLQMGTDRKLWVNWNCEGQDDPNYPIQ